MKARMPFSPFTVHHSQVSSPSQGSKRSLAHDSPLTTNASRSFISRLTTHDSRAFTVVELSVVLVIIGIIVGGVLKLETVYRNYKIKAVINQYRELSAAVKVYRDRFGYWPGDDPRSSIHVDPTIANGNGDDIIGYASDGISSVAEYYWGIKALGSCDLVKLQGGLLYHSFGGRLDIEADKFLIGGTTSQKNNIRFMNLPSDVAQALDIALDDGRYDSGMVRGWSMGLPPGYTMTPFAYSAAQTVPFTTVFFQ